MALQCADAGSRIPDVVWGGLVTLAGACVALIANYALQRQKMRQDALLQEQKLTVEAKEKAADRLHSLKKEVYLPAITAVADTNRRLGMLLSPEVDSTEIGRELAAGASAIGKTTAFAPVELIRRVMEFQVATNETFSKLMALRVPLAVAHSSLKNAQANWESGNVARGQAWQVYHSAQLRDAGEKDLVPLRSEAEIAEKMLEHHSFQMDKGFRDQFKAQLAMLETMRSELVRVQPLFTPLIKAFRADIALQQDDELEGVYTSAAEQNLRGFDDAIESLRESLVEAERKVLEKEQG